MDVTSRVVRVDRGNPVAVRGLAGGGILLGAYESGFTGR
jgi:hypothetical protein